MKRCSSFSFYASMVSLLIATLDYLRLRWYGNGMPKETASVGEKMEERRKQRMESAPTSARGLLGRIFAGRASPRACVKGMCLECVGFERAAVRECVAWACPLWGIRPFQGKGDEGAEVEE